MKVRLTITIDEELARKIKLYAKENKTSVSKIVEECLKKLFDAKENKS